MSSPNLNQMSKTEMKEFIQTSVLTQVEAVYHDIDTYLEVGLCTPHRAELLRVEATKQITRVRKLFGWE